jgi:pimeloyl-ACP methyl ester carboxylesterase
MTKPNLLLLHGAIGTADQFAALVPLLSDRFTVHTLDFEGHGAAPLTAAAFSMERFAESVREYLEQHAIEQTAIFGYSMGGYVACLLALRSPERVAGIMTLGTKFYWTPEVAEREVGLLDPQKIAAKVPRFAQVLAARHPALGWEVVLGHTAAMLRALGQQGGLRPSDVTGLDRRVRVSIGDRDSTVTLAESVEMTQALPHGELEVLPGTPHPFERVPLPRLAYSLTDFFGQA